MRRHPKKYRCEECRCKCDLHTVDHGGYEEVWGARVWHPMPTDVSDCCHADVEEVPPSDDAYDNDVPDQENNYEI